MCVPFSTSPLLKTSSKNKQLKLTRQNTKFCIGNSPMDVKVFENTAKFFEPKVHCFLAHATRKRRN